MAVRKELKAEGLHTEAVCCFYSIPFGFSMTTVVNSSMKLLR